MDDFGNTYQTEAWAYGCEQFAHSTATYGMLDDACLDWCMMHGIGYWRADV
jgi:hypothetical protein